METSGLTQEPHDGMPTFRQAIDMLRTDHCPVVVQKRSDGRLIAKRSKASAVHSTAPEVSFENWFWRIASNPTCFLVLMLCNEVAELLAPI